VLLLAVLRSTLARVILLSTLLQFFLINALVLQDLQEGRGFHESFGLELELESELEELELELELELSLTEESLLEALKAS
jgi:hypothetical protein